MKKGVRFRTPFRCCDSGRLLQVEDVARTGGHGTEAELFRQAGGDMRGALLPYHQFAEQRHQGRHGSCLPN